MILIEEIIEKYHHIKKKKKLSSYLYHEQNVSIKAREKKSYV